MKGDLYIISGPAGAGKTEIVKRLIADHPQIGLSVSYTTRAPRANEKEGVDYHFATDSEFDEVIARDGFYEWAFVHQNRYGSPRLAIERELEKGRDMILEIDVQGCRNVKEKTPGATGIFICPPSAESLEKRLRGRNSETEESLRVRLGNAAGEIAASRYYDYVVINEDRDVVPDAVGIAAGRIWAIMTAKKLERGRCSELMDEIEKALKREDRTI